MGWSSGTNLIENVWDIVRKEIPEKKRVNILAKIIDAFTDEDWDCVEEIEDLWPESKKALRKAVPEYGEEEE